MFQGLPIPVWAKLAIAIAFDLFDMTFGRLMVGVGLVGDVGTALIMFLLFGPTGLLALWEVAEVSEQLDGFIPTNTLIAWKVHQSQLKQLET